jgi:hypothetical protein
MPEKSCPRLTVLLAEGPSKLGSGRDAPWHWLTSPQDPIGLLHECTSQEEPVVVESGFKQGVHIIFSKSTSACEILPASQNRNQYLYTVSTSQNLNTLPRYGIRDLLHIYPMPATFLVLSTSDTIVSSSSLHPIPALQYHYILSLFPPSPSFRIPRPVKVLMMLGMVGSSDSQAWETSGQEGSEEKVPGTASCGLVDGWRATGGSDLESAKSSRDMYTWRSHKGRGQHRAGQFCVLPQLS